MDWNWSRELTRTLEAFPTTRRTHEYMYSYNRFIGTVDFYCGFPGFARPSNIPMLSFQSTEQQRTLKCYNYKYTARYILIIKLLFNLKFWILIFSNRNIFLLCISLQSPKGKWNKRMYVCITSKKIRGSTLLDSDED